MLNASFVTAMRPRALATVAASTAAAGLVGVAGVSVDEDPENGLFIGSVSIAADDAGAGLRRALLPGEEHEGSGRGERLMAAWPMERER